MRIRFHLGLVGALALGGAARAASDYQFTLSESGMVDFVLTSVSSTDVYAGSLPANDPTINLVVGKRYGVNNTAASAGHPFEIIAKGTSSSSDTVLLSQSGTGPLESDSEINWVELDTNNFEFTMTATLASSMRAGGATPGYRCNVHPDDMRGSFALFGAGTVIADPVPDIPRGTIAIALQPVVTGMRAPLGVVDPDDGTGRLFIYEQSGKIHILLAGSLLPTPFLDVSGRLVTLGFFGTQTETDFDERGLIGFTLHPNFATNGKVYTYTSEPYAGPSTADFPITMTGTPNHQGVLAEWTVDGGNANVINTASRRELMRWDEPQFNHDGGQIDFGPDGLLYIALGDGGSSDDFADGHSPEGNGQDTTNILGSILRIDVDGNNSANGQYGVPASNPFVGGPGVDEIYAYGFRNPFRFSFDGADLFVADVGQNHIEELNVVTLGGNYGWPIKEGSFFFDNNGAAAGRVVTEPMFPFTATLAEPIAEYDHGDGLSIIGGYHYGAGEIAGLDGLYVFGDFSTAFSTANGRLFYLSATNEILEFEMPPSNAPMGKYLKGFGTDAAGNVYVCASSALGPFGTGGVVYKIVGTDAAAGNWLLYR